MPNWYKLAKKNHRKTWNRCWTRYSMPCCCSEIL